uniref:Uncharacterized protein n=1 Tax=Chenopodium quinoa TaxID=63459 RepID=A0A803MV58_CHEQI
MNPLHFDTECAQIAGFQDRLVHGMLVASLFPRIISSHFPGAVYVSQNLQFRQPVYVEDEIVGEVQALNIRNFKQNYLIASIAQRKRLMSTGNTLKEVLLFFSRSNQLAFARNAFREVKMTRERLDDISKDHRDYYSRSPCASSRGRIVTKRREDSHSFVYAEDVIGRDADKKAIIEMLLDSSVRDAVHFVTIVGIGGLGKTTLCSIDSTANQHLEVEELQRQVRWKINRQRFLLILDDVWNEDRHEWLKLRNLYIGGESGSRVVVTSRSKLVATIVGAGPTYELQGLSPKHSWSLFEKMAFKN